MSENRNRSDGEQSEEHVVDSHWQHIGGETITLLETDKQTEWIQANNGVDVESWA